MEMEMEREGMGPSLPRSTSSLSLPPPIHRQVYQKRTDSPSLRPYQRALTEQRDRLAALPHAAAHVLPWAVIRETPRGAHLVRPHAHTSVAAALSTRPFMSPAEKRWVAWQVLVTLADAHGAGVVHGDLKPENVLLTSGGWALLADWSAAYKPAALPVDNPADFSLFFDAPGGRRRCCLAPERFVEGGSRSGPPTPAHTPAMDVFAAGCVLAELFADGRPLFDLPALLAYRKGSGADDPVSALADIAAAAGGAAFDPPMQALVRAMVAPDPAARPSAAECVARLGACGAVPPGRAALLHAVWADQLGRDADGRVAALARAWPRLVGKHREEGGGGEGGGRGRVADEPASSPPAPAAPAAPPTPSLVPDLGALLADTEGLLARLSEGGGGERLAGAAAAAPAEAADAADAAAAPTAASPPPAASPSPRRPHAPAADLAAILAGTGGGGSGPRPPPSPSPSPSPSPRDDIPALVTHLACSLVRGARSTDARVCAVGLVGAAAAAADDGARLQRAVPYLLASATGDPAARVRAAALRSLARVVGAVAALPPGDGRVFSEYIFPALSLVPADPDECVRVQWAGCVVPVALAAARLVVMGGGEAPGPLPPGALAAAADRADEEARSEASGVPDAATATATATTAATAAAAAPAPADEAADEAAALVRCVERAVHDLAVGPATGAAARCALLPWLDALAGLLGRREANDFLLPLAITFLNDRDWRARAAFLARAGGLAAAAGPAGLEAFLLPCLEQALGDGEPAVVAAAVDFLAAAAGDGGSGGVGGGGTPTHACILRKRALLAAARRVLPALLSPSAPPVVRAAAVRFAAAAARALSPGEAHSLLGPLVAPALARPPADPGAAADLAACLLPVAEEQGAPGPLPPSTPLKETTSAPVLAVPTGGDAAGPDASALANALAVAGVVGGGGGPGPPSSSSFFAVPAEALAATACRVPLPGEAAGAAGLGGAGWLGLFGMGGGGGGGAGGGPAPSDDTASASARLVLQASRVLAAEAAAVAAAAAAAGGVPAAPSAANPAIAAALAGALPTGGASGAAADGASSPPPSTTPWRPRGVPLAHLAEHSRGVAGLAVALGGRFFVSASSDGTARVWDVAGLERDVSQRSRGVYGGGGGSSGPSSPLTAVAACADGDTVATGGADGAIHVWRASYARGSGGGASAGRPQGPERVAGLAAVGARPPLPAEGAITALADWGRLLLYATLRGGVRGWDVRMDGGRGAQATAWALDCDPREGSVSVVLGGGGGIGGGDASTPVDAWLLSGTSRGVVSVWDARLALRASAWRLPGGARVRAAVAATAPRARLGVRGGGAPAGPLVWIAAAGEAGLYDVGERHAGGGPDGRPPRHAPLALFRVVEDGSVPTTAPPVPSLLAEPAGPPLPPHLPSLDPLTPSTPLTGIQALLSTGAGPLLTGSADGRVRLWDGAAPEESYIVAGDPGGDGGEGGAPPTPPASPAPPPPSRARMYARRTVGGLPVVEEAPCAAVVVAPAAAAHSSARMVEPSSARALAHRDAVTALAAVEGAGGVRLLLSAGRDGVVKAWR